MAGEHNLSIAASRATLRVFESWANETVILPKDGIHFSQTFSSNQTETVYPIDAGPVHVSWGTDGTGALLTSDGRVAVGPPFRIHAVGGNFEALTTQSSYNLDQAPSREGGRIVESIVGIHDWGRLVDFVGSQSLQATGNFALLLKGATIEAASQRIELPAYHRETVTGNDLGSVRRSHYVHAFLHVQDGRTKMLASEIRPYCGSLEARISGVYQAFDSRGVLQSNEQSLTFERRELSLTGAFGLREGPADENPSPGQAAPVAAEANGQFAAAGLDFVTIKGIGNGPNPAKAAAWAAAGTLSVLILWKVIGFLFTRLREDRLLDLNTRKRIVDAVAANPGIRMNELAPLASVNPSSARYHLRVLERHGQLRAQKVLGVWRYVDSSQAGRTRTRELMLGWEPRFQDLLRQVEHGPASGGKVAEKMGREWGMSRSGTWKLIGAAVKHGLLIKDRRGREVVLRAAS